MKGQRVVGKVYCYDEDVTTTYVLPTVVSPQTHLWSGAVS